MESPARRKSKEAIRLAAIRKRDVTIPTVCFPQCNNVYIEGQKTGMTAALCEPNSTFISDFHSCTDCISANKFSAAVTSTPSFASYIGYCASQLPAQSATASAIVYVTRNSSDPTFTPAASITPAPTPTPARLPSTENGKHSKPTWIVGAVLGPLLAVFAISAFFAFRRGRQQRKRSVAVVNEDDNMTKDKAQLHADSLQRFELPTERYSELPTERNDHVRELPALEPVGSELMSDSLNRNLRNESRENKD